MISDQIRHTIAPLLDNLTIVLVRPKYPENIGAAARIAKNMGISRLIIIRDESPDLERVRKMATHHAVDLVENMQIHPTVTDALATFSHVVAATARMGRQRRTMHAPRNMASALVPLLGNNKVALMFGPEDSGLANEDLQFCNQLVTIPTIGTSSLNLAQSVGIFCYEVVTALVEHCRRDHTPFVPRQATVRELDGLYSHLEETLGTIGFLKEADHDYWMQSVRQFIGRQGLRAREVQILRGICRQFLWYEKKVEGKNCGKNESSIQLDTD